MRCLSPAELAAAATAGVLDEHLLECLACRRAYEAQRELRARLQRLAAPTLGVDRRRAIAAELAARAPVEPPRRASRSIPAASLIAAASLAAAAAAWTWWPARAVAIAPRVARVELAAAARPVDGAPSGSPSGSPTVPAIARGAPSALALPAPRIAAGRGTRLSHRVGARRDVLTLVDGNVTVDTRAARDVDVRVGESVVRLEDASVRIRAREREIVSVQIVVGSARVMTPGGDAQRDDLTLSEPPQERHALDAFRDGWIALRAGRDREAMALFDQATDPVVAEEAAYWAAIAARRAGDEAVAVARFAAFVQRFPTSPYVARIHGSR